MFSKAHVSRWSFFVVTMTVFASLNLYTVSAQGASVDKNSPVVSPNIPVPKAEVPVPTVKAPVPVAKPSVKLNDNTSKAISKPVAPSTAKIPNKEIKPQNVPRPAAASKPVTGDAARLTKIQNPQGITGGAIPETLPAARTDVPVPVRNMSRSVSTDLGPADRPGLDEKRLKEIGEIQRNTIDAARAARELEQIQNGSNAIPEVNDVDRAAGNALEGRGIGAGEGVDADKFVREAFFGRMSGEDSQNILKNGGIGVPDDQLGSFTRRQSPGDAVRDPGYLSSGPKPTPGPNPNWNIGSADTSEGDGFYFARGSDGVRNIVITPLDGGGRRVSDVTRMNDGRSRLIVEIQNNDGSGTQTTTIDDGNGNTVVTKKPLPPPPPPPPPEEGSQPNETGYSKSDPCGWNPVTGRCRNKPRTKVWDASTQPSKGEASTGPGSSAPNVGAAAVTNPDEFNTRGGSGRRGIGTGGEAVDPEEIVPVPGGIGLDERMGAIESN